MNTSEFARLCKVSKRTLFHYDSIGLVKPFLVQENGYREYNIVQLQKMDTIKIFQKAGYSLNEIKRIYTLGPDEVEGYLQEAKLMLQKKITEFEQMRHYLDNKLSMYEEYKRNGDRITKGEFAVAAEYISQKDEDHFLSFLQDDFYEFSKLDNHNQMYIQKSDSLKTICGYAFFLKIKSEVSSIIPQIQQRLNEIDVTDPGEYYISVIPHALIEDSETAIVRVVVKGQK